MRRATRVRLFLLGLFLLFGGFMLRAAVTGFVAGEVVVTEFDAFPIIGLAVIVVAVALIAIEALWARERRARAEAERRKERISLI